FFFQAEDGIRDFHVTGVQTCALPILLPSMIERRRGHVVFSSTMSTQLPIPLFSAYLASKSALESYARSLMAELGSSGITTTIVRSEERRVGKEWSSRSPAVA